MNEHDKTTTSSNNAPTSSELDALLRDFPAEIQGMIRAAWEKLPDGQRDQLLEIVPFVTSRGAGGIQRLLEMAQSNVQMAFGAKREIAVVGPANVGKSTLYNQLIQNEGDAAAVSPIPGTTKEAQAADAGIFTIIDTPGADAAGAAGERERRLAVLAARAADFLIILFDATVGIRQNEQLLFEELKALEKPFIVVLNKMDLIGRKQREEVIAGAAVNLTLPASQIIPISAKEGDRLERVLLAIVKAEPALLAALGQALPQYRARLAWQAIVRAASTSAVIALTPIPMVDFIPIVATQASMVLAIARAYEYKLTPARAKELVGTLGVGYLGRTLFYELSKLGGPPGWLLSAAVAASTTVVLGFAAIRWFERGERLTAEASRRLTRQLAERLLARLKELGGRPSRRKLRRKLRDEMAAVLAEEEGWLRDGEDQPSAGEMGSVK